MLALEGIHTFYGETEALFGVSLEVKAGEVVALLGPNGAGKTTTLRSILNLSEVRAGSIRFDGADITRMPTHRIARRGIGWVPDDRRIFPPCVIVRAVFQPVFRVFPATHRSGTLTASAAPARCGYTTRQRRGSAPR
jgi:ABC-type branched-subunit amino acid transport system ATPase component